MPRDRRVSVPAVVSRVGGLSLAALGAAYVGAVLIAVVVVALVPALVPVARVLDGLLFAALFVVATWFRDEDALAAGVFLALATGVAQLVIRVVTEVMTSGGVGGVVLMLPAVALTLVVRAAVAGAVCAALVWVARTITTAVRPGWRPPSAAAAPPADAGRPGLFPKRRA
jgi:hypothetical protein